MFGCCKYTPPLTLLNKILFTCNNYPACIGLKINTELVSLLLKHCMSMHAYSDEEHHHTLNSSTRSVV